jgi:nicotinate-nucleotide adenylyltransferase
VSGRDASVEGAEVARVEGRAVIDDVERRLVDASRLGLFGGTFDPVHLGHLHVARTALEVASLDAVVFVPAARSPHKEGGSVASGEERLEMLRLATADEPRFVVWDVELRRGEPSYTVETVRELVRMRGDGQGGLHLILGSDNLTGLGTWLGLGEILAAARPIVVERRGATADVLDSIEGLSEADVERLRAGFVAREPVDVSATPLRRRLGRGDGEDEVPPAVWEYLRRRGIYGAR